MRAIGRVDQLSGDAHPIAGFANAPFEHVAHAELAADPLLVYGLALVGEAGIAAMTNSQRIRLSAVMISSTMPSAK